MSFWRPTDEERLARIRRRFEQRYFWGGLFFLMGSVLLAAAYLSTKVATRGLDAISEAEETVNAPSAVTYDGAESDRAEFNRQSAETRFYLGLSTGGAIWMAVVIGMWSFCCGIMKLAGGWDQNTQFLLAQLDAATFAQPDGTE